MDDSTLEAHVLNLQATKASLSGSIAESTEDTTELEAELAEVEEMLEIACADPRSDCPTDSASGTTTTDTSESIPMDLVFAGIGILIVALLIGLMFTRSGSKNEVEDWSATMLPANDMVANSMYGGAQEIFQAPAPVVQQQQYAGPPLPATGLPVGWSMEQWVHYGQQYLDQNKL
jgi:hypothetical protein